MAIEASVASIFYARFHDEYGPKVLHQVPEGSVIPCPPSPTALKQPFFDFQSLSSYLIPNREFCNRALRICSNGYRIIGYPICITDPDKYERNDFIFNFCIVLNDEADFTPYKGIVTKLARLFANLEEQNGFLSREEADDAILVAGTEGYGGERGSKVFAVVEMVFEDLKSVGETMIPIDESNTLNLSLFPTKPPPPPIKDFHVPLSVVRFESLQTSAWDLTVQKILPHIDGINSVSRISQLADTDPRLTRRAIQHLAFYECILLLDIFTFSAIYAPTPLISQFLQSTEMQDECRRYVFNSASPFGRSTTVTKPAVTSRDGESSGSHRRHRSSQTSSSKQNLPAIQPHSNSNHPVLPSRMHMVNLYSSMRQGLALREFCISHAAELINIDVHRLITFGVIKGFLYRVHKYALHSNTASSTSEKEVLADAEKARRQGPKWAESARVRGVGTKQRAKEEEPEDEEAAWRVAALSSGWRLPDRVEGKGVPRHLPVLRREGKEKQKVDGGTEAGESGGTSSARRKAGREALRFADGLSCFDEICMEMKVPEAEAIERIRGAVEAGEVVLICK